MKVYEETAEYQDANVLSGNWRESGYNLQSVTFYNKLVEHLKDSMIWDLIGRHSEWEYEVESGIISFNTATIHDWGCSFGNGTAILQAAFPAASVVGYDYSIECIKMSQDRWPTCSFVHMDIRDACDHADVIITSHTIEHLEHPGKVIENLRGLCQWLIVLLPPIVPGKDGGHVGAVLTKDLLKMISPPPIYAESFITLRKYGADGKEMMVEGSLLLLIQGKAGKMYIVDND